MLNCGNKRSRLNALLYLRAVILIGMAVVALFGASVRAQEDPSAIIKELTDLQQQMAAADAPCPYLPKLRAIVNRMANTSPEVYQAMKPSLDEMNKTDDGCSPNNNSAQTTVPTSSPTPNAATPPQREGAPPPGAEICPSSGHIDAGEQGEFRCRPGQQVTALPAMPSTQPQKAKRTTGKTANGEAQTRQEIANNNNGAGCATDNSGASMPIVPGTTAPTCNLSVCRDAGLVIHLEAQWKDKDQTEVVGYFTNDSISDVTCTSAFHKNGAWTEYGTGVIKAGARHQGGEFGGMFSMGVDSSDIRYVCYMGNWPVNEHGRYCNMGIKFTGPTIAGSDHQNRAASGAVSVE
ncbi:hypothetical protein HDF15_002174 [Granulicella mallensis]|uniref:Uncharacterized protein n=1 Tax=Granulicella mallensis TaxID=940614 RepID=A0A7W8E9Q5_9BACT|nr:hypothetical protein [Granulicella mallensis]